MQITHKSHGVMFIQPHKILCNCQLLYITVHMYVYTYVNNQYTIMYNVQNKSLGHCETHQFLSPILTLHQTCRPIPGAASVSSVTQQDDTYST